MTYDQDDPFAYEAELERRYRFEVIGEHSPGMQWQSYGADLAGLTDDMDKAKEIVVSLLSDWLAVRVIDRETDQVVCTRHRPTTVGSV